MFCQNCGSSLDPGARFCAACGSSQPVEIEPGSPVRIAAAQPVLTGGQSDTVRWIGEGWEMVKDDLGTFVLMTIVMMVVNGAVPILLQGATAAGFQAACKKKLRGVKPQIADLFTGFEFFVATLIAHIVISILIFIGGILFIIPGLLAAAIFNFHVLVHHR